MFEPLISRFNNRVSLIAEDQAAVFESCLRQLASHEKAEELLDSPLLGAAEQFWYPSDDWRAAYRPYKVTDGMLIIPVRGVLLHDFPWQMGAWATGYIYILKAVERGLADPEVKGIAFVIHSPGGEVAGCFELVDKLYNMRGQKPMRGFAHEFAYSAAYAVISAVDPGGITVSKTGGVGSIGVVTMHVNYSGSLEQQGIEITFIHRGKHKVDGNPYQALSESVKARIQQRIDAAGVVFESTVARNRGMDEATVRGFEALTFMPEEATSNGLADKIGPLDEALSAYADDLSANEGDERMTDKTTATDQAANTAAVEAARAEGFAAGKAEGFTAGKAEGAKATTERFKAIIESEEGKTRPRAALSMAVKMTSASAEEVCAVLADLAEEKPDTASTEEKPDGNAKAGNAFLTAMDRAAHPEVGSEDADDKDDKDKADSAESDLRLAAMAGLPGFKKRQKA